MEQTLNLISESLGISIDILKGRNRKRDFVLARQIFCYIESQYNTLSDVGKFLGGRDHTTVIHSKNAIKNFMETNDSKLNKAIVRLPRYMIDMMYHGGDFIIYKNPKIISLQTLNK